MLDDHRLASVEPLPFQDRFPRYVGRNAKGNPSRYGAGGQIRILTTDQGAVGWANCGAMEEVTNPLIGERISDLFQPDVGAQDKGMPLDQPLHDLAGRILGKPVYEMLGSKGPRDVPIYSGAIYFDDMEPEDDPRGVPGVVASCQQDYDAGYRAFKLKIGRGFKWFDLEEGIQRDIDVVRAVREAFLDCKILVDANDAYTCDDFIRFVDGTVDCDLYWFEEPFPEDEDDLRRLKDHMAMVGCEALIAEGEGRSEHSDQPTAYGGYTEAHIRNLYQLAEKGLVDAVVIDLNIVGFTRWRQVMPELAAAGILAAPHTWVWCARPFLTAHLAAGVGNVVCIEGIPGTTSVLDYSNYQISDGNVHLPDGPGFDMPLKEESALEQLEIH